nr:MAG TPA: hypothetical protein [Bacteriophage sp.]
MNILKFLLVTDFVPIIRPYICCGNSNSILKHT